MTKLDAIHNYAISKKLTDDEGIQELINLASDAIKNSNDTEINKAYIVLESLKNLNLYDGDIELTQDTETETWTYLMFKNIPTLKFTIGHNKWVILNEGYLPFYLRSVIKNVTMSDTETLNVAINNWDLFMGFAASRVIAMDRAHAKAILGHWGFSDLDSPQIKASLAIKCNLLSTEDKYWICTDPEKVRWEDVDITTKPTHETIVALALQGRSSLIKDALAIPELTTRGIFPKAWVRNNGKLYLYKDHMYGFPDSVDIEVSVSKILDALKIRHVNYDKIQYNGMTLSCCENMTTPNLSRVSAKELEIYAKHNGKKLADYLAELNDDLFYQMLIVDYLVSNIDRHDNNWGFYYDNNCCLVSLHPLFDHNMAFNSDAMYHDYQSRVMPEYSLFELARHACKKINFPSVAPVKVNMFHSREHYESFKEHCSKLNLK